MKQHPIGKLLPAMTPEEYHQTKLDIQKRGLLDPIIVFDGMVLDGWHRYQICRELGIKPIFRTLRKGADALGEVVSRNLARRQLTPGQRYGVLLRIAAKYPEVQARLDGIRAEAKARQLDGVPVSHETQRSSEVIGRLAGVSHSTVDRVDRLRKLSPSAFQEMVEGKETLLHLLNRAGAEKRREKREALRAAPSFVPEIRLLAGDFRKVLANETVPPIRLAFADLPWDRTTLPLWADVGRLAERVLAPGGVLAAYPSKVEMAAVMASLGQHLRYHWCFAALHHEPLPLPKLRVLSKWQPILLFVKGSFTPPLSLLDVLDAEGKERDRHRWQRPVEEFVTLIEGLTRPGDWVLDMAAGSFASAKAAQVTGRNYVGVDVDKAAVAKARAWIGAARG